MRYAPIAVMGVFRRSHCGSIARNCSSHGNGGLRELETSSSRNLLVYEYVDGCNAAKAVSQAGAKSRRAALHLCLLDHLKCIIDINAEIAHGTLDLRVTEQNLHRTQVLRPLSVSWRQLQVALTPRTHPKVIRRCVTH